VSAVLGDRLQGVVVDAPVTGASGVELLKQLKEGRTTFLPVSNVRTQPADEAHGEREGRPLGWSAPNFDGGSIEVVDLSEEQPASRTEGPERSEGVGARAGEAEHDPSPTRWREEDSIEITLYSASAEQPRPD